MIEIRPLRTPAECRAAFELQKETWGHGFSETVPPALLWATQRVGGIAAGAFDADGRLVGFVFGLTGLERGRPVHWSDMLAVRPELRDRGLGTRLKAYQRDELLRLGIGVVYWTFDPLESKNAYVNFARLGITAREYHRDLYGETDSPLHRGIGTDRLVALWAIDGERVRGRLAGDAPAPGAAEVAAVPYALGPRAGPAGPAGPAGAAGPEPGEPGEPDLSLEADRVRIAIPADIQALKAAAPALAAEWRRRTRAAFEAYFGRGYEAVELVREGETSSYVLALVRADRPALDR